jgi:cytochrome c553
VDQRHSSRRQHTSTRSRQACAAAALALLLLPAAAPAADFGSDLARVDAALRSNPVGIHPATLESCRSRRNFAVRLEQSGYHDRAARSLDFCMTMLGITDAAVAKKRAPEVAPPTAEEIQARATREIEKALHLEANLENGLAVYRECAACHSPEGWGLSNGSVPQLAGQHRQVVIKQLADIRAGNRDNVLMVPYSSVESIGGTQAVADVAGYIDTLEISADNGKGPGDDLELGARIYREKCVECHGETGEGNNAEFTPRIQAQHYNYLVRQFEWIKAGKRRNANQDMVAQIQEFDEREILAVLDYVSRLEPPEDFQAPPGWRNPDFAN